MSDIYFVLRALKRRWLLSQELELYLENLERGYKGESRFAVDILDGLTCAHVLLRDLRLPMDNNHFQLDAVLLSGKQMIIFEVKNWSGSFVYQDGQFMSRRSAKPYKNPTEQLGRCVSNMQYLLRKWGYDFEVIGRVVFINPSFYLYGAPLDQPFLFAPELADWVKGLNRFDGWVNERHRSLAALLVSKDCPAKVDFEILPEFTFNGLKKGLDCCSCGSFTTQVVGQRVRCLDCGAVERTEEAIVRMAEELAQLFPKTKITSRLVGEYCGGVFTTKRIRQNLTMKYGKQGKTKGTFFLIRT